MRNKKRSEDASIFFEILSETPAENKNFIKKSMAIARRLHQILKEKEISQKVLAGKLNKTEPEISKWLAGGHNFTIRTLTAIETVLNEEIVITVFRQNNNSRLHGPVSISLPPRRVNTSKTAIRDYSKR